MPDQFPLPVTERTLHRRLREQDSTDRTDLADILAAGVICHLGVVVDGYPMVVPTAYGQADDTLYLLPPGIPLPPHLAARIRRPLG